MIDFIPILLLLLILTGCLIGIYVEKRDYNNGICPKCGTKLTHFDNDSQGGRGYTCRKCGYTTWVSWFADKNK